MKTPRSTASVLLVFALAGASTAGAAARVVGHRDCEKCHKPAIQQWSQTEPAALGADAHFSTHKQLSGGDAAKYAAAIGLADPSDPSGSCAGCHATVIRGRVRAGVSCETCHGPASDYLEVHDKEPWTESYAKSIPLGMRDLHARTAAIAKLCVDCHVTPDRRLAAAGHPNGSDFDAGASLQKIVHWTAAFTPNQQVHASYDFAKVSADARPLVANRLSRGGGGGGSASGGGGGATAAVDAPAPRPVASAADPWDWNEPVAALPEDYPSEEARPPVRTTRPAAPRVAAASIAEDLPLARDDLPAVEPPPEGAEEDLATAESPAARLAELRGRAAVLLGELLRAGSRAPRIEPPAPPAEYQGPDGELLHIQDVVLYLALETLRSPKP